MLMVGIVQELSRQDPTSGSNIMSYFFCQGTDSSLNHATAVLRGLLYLLLLQNRHLIFYLHEKYDVAGSNLFEGPNVFSALLGVFANIFKHPDIIHVCFIVDALDECETDLPLLLDLINSTSSQVKWLVSSRNVRGIEKQLGPDQGQSQIILELNANSISNAVDVYIQYKVSELARRQKYDSKLQGEVEDELY